MPELTEKELKSFAELAKSIAPKDENAKGREEAYAAMVIKTMREQFTDTDDVTLARVCNMVAFIMHKFGKMTVCELHMALENMLVSYGLASATLAGVCEIGADVSAPAADETEDGRHVAPLIGQYL
jgi:hypothetical protein